MAERNDGILRNEDGQFYNTEKKGEIRIQRRWVSGKTWNHRKRGRKERE